MYSINYNPKNNRIFVNFEKILDVDEVRDYVDELLDVLKNVLPNATMLIDSREGRMASQAARNELKKMFDSQDFSKLRKGAVVMDNPPNEKIKQGHFEERFFESMLEAVKFLDKP